jgi:hypothetical protein
LKRGGGVDVARGAELARALRAARAYVAALRAVRLRYEAAVWRAGPRPGSRAA